MNQSGPKDLAQALFQESGDALFLFDPDTDIVLDVNRMAERLCGYPRAELVRLPATQLFRFGGKGGESRLRQAAGRTGVFHSQEGFYLRNRQEGVWGPVNLTVTRLHVQPKTLALITARDVRERYEAHARLVKVEAELRRVLSSVSDCLWSADYTPEGALLFRYVSPVVEALTGRPPQHFLGPGRNWEAVIHPEDRRAWRQALERLRGGQPSRQEYRVVWPDGAVHWLRDSVRVTRKPDGRTLQLDGVLTDVTDLKLAEAERDRFFTLSLDLLCIADFDGRFKRLNPAWEQVLGYPLSELLARRFLDLVHPDDLEATRAQLDRLRVGEKLVPFENR